MQQDTFPVMMKMMNLGGIKMTSLFFKYHSTQDLWIIAENTNPTSRKLNLMHFIKSALMRTYLELPQEPEGQLNEQDIDALIRFKILPNTYDEDLDDDDVWIQYLNPRHCITIQIGPEISIHGQSEAIFAFEDLDANESKIEKYIEKNCPDFYPEFGAGDDYLILYHSYASQKFDTADLLHEILMDFDKELIKSQNMISNLSSSIDRKLEELQWELTSKKDWSCEKQFHSIFEDELRKRTR